MNQVCCFLCDLDCTSPSVLTADLFKDNTFPSGRTLCEVVSELVSRPVEKDAVHSNVICEKCVLLCEEYHRITERLQNIKQDVIEKFNKVQEKILNLSNKSSQKKVVVPASKLQPLPPNYVLRLGKDVVAQRKSIMPAPVLVTYGSTIIQPKLTVTTTVTSKSPPNLFKTCTVNLENSKVDLTKYLDCLPKDFMSATEKNNEITIGDEIEGDIQNDDGNTADSQEAGVHEEEVMEIDEACTFTVITNDQTDKSTDTETAKQQYVVDMDYLAEITKVTDIKQEYVMDGVEIANDQDDNEAGTVVVESDQGSIFRVVGGTKLMYGDNEISFIVPGQENASEDEGHDSNDDQFELQVSGDEETANAIIQAAKEQGGAFIKVESGEMYRVKSIESKTNDEDIISDLNHIQPLVAREGNFFKCLLCEKSGTSSEAGDISTICTHMRGAHDARVYICGSCFQVFTKKHEYTDHVGVNVEEARYICQECDKKRVVVSQSRCVKYSKNNKTKTFECDKCHKKYSSRTLLLEHSKQHQGQSAHTCETCRKTFANKYTLQSHMKVHSQRERSFKCKQCDKSFYSQAYLTAHEKTHLGEKNFICSICNKAFSSLHNLEVHGLVHSKVKPFECTHCGKGFARRNEVRDHMRTHTGERPFACEICGARFSQRSNLCSHKRATHFEERRYPCDLCSKRFKRRRLLDYHKKAVHTGVRDLKCDICGSTFVYPEHLRKHIRTHSGVKPFGCELCGKTFNSRENRNSHRFVHSEKKHYECLVCGAGYMRKQLLYAHMNTSGHLAESIVVNQPRVSKVEEPDENVVFEVANYGDNNTAAVKEEVVTQMTSHTEKAGQVSSSHGATDPMLSLPNLEANAKVENALLEGLSVMGEQVQLVGSDETGGFVRLVQIQLADGNNGWVAVNQ